MQVTSKSRLYNRLQNILFVAAFLVLIGMLAWLSTRYVFQADWTASGRNTLSPASQTLLKKLNGPLSITAFTSEAQPLRKGIGEMVKRYQRYKPDIRLSFVDPAKEPQRVRDLGISVDGELVIDYAGRSEKLQDINEQNLTNALQRVGRSDKRWLVFLTGHGERNPLGVANHDLGDWGRQLESKGFSVQTVNLVSTPQIPGNTDVLAIAAPQVDLLPGEIKLIQDFINKGGNLLWLSDPGPLHGLKPVAEQLGVEFQPGVIVDPNAQLFGVKNPDFAVVAEYSSHPITLNFNNVTLFPRASGIDLQTPEGWQGQAFLTTLPRSWSETGEIKGEISFDAGSDIQGPLDIAVSLTRALPDNANTQGKEQRVVVMGDGDFVSNTYLGNGDNLNLGLNIVNWLSHDDKLIAIRAITAPDTELNLSFTASVLIGFGFLFALPLALLIAGLTIWLKRRKR
jgi:ABC-type uncharacterized transport system involved in gliding motility auxiliary subunit